MASTFSGAAISVNADDVTIDLNGFVVSGPGRTGSSRGVETLSNAVNRLTVRNGYVRNFGLAGITTGGISENGIRVDSVTVSAIGDGVPDTGIWLNGQGHLIQNCIVDDVNGRGVLVVQGIVKNTTVTNITGTGIQSNSSLIIDSLIAATGTAISSGANSVSDRNVIIAL